FELPTLVGESVGESLQHLADQGVRFFDCTTRLVDEARLDAAPACAKRRRVLVDEERRMRLQLIRLRSRLIARGGLFHIGCQARFLSRRGVSRSSSKSAR